MKSYGLIERRAFVISHRAGKVNSACGGVGKSLSIRYPRREFYGAAVFLSVLWLYRWQWR